MAGSSMTRIQLKLIKIGARVVHHAHAIIYQLAEVAVTGAMVRDIHRLRAPQLFTCLRSRFKLNKNGTTGLSAALKSTSGEKGLTSEQLRATHPNGRPLGECR